MLCLQLQLFSKLIFVCVPYKMWACSPTRSSTWLLPRWLSSPQLARSHLGAHCCSVRSGWGELLAERVKGEGLGGMQMVQLCKPIFLLNKRIRFCLGPNSFCALIPSVSVCAQWLLPCGRSPGLAVLWLPEASLPTARPAPLWGAISTAFACCAWPEAQYVSVTGVWQLCWKH